MRRAVVQNLRTLRRPSPRKCAKLRIASSSNGFGQRGLATRSGQQLHFLMQHRRFSLPIALGVAAAGGAWYYQNSAGQAGADVAASPARGYSAAAASSAPPTVGGIGPEAVRKALVVEQGELFTANIAADEVISKETDYSGRKMLEMMTPAQVTVKLRTNEESYLVGRGEGVVRYDVVQIPSNDPIEDDHVEKIVEVPGTTAASEEGRASSDWMFWGVFDGHAGWTTSAKLRQTLVSYVARELNETYRAALTASGLAVPPSDAVDSAIKKAFLRLDHEITHDSVQKVLKAGSKRVAAELLAPALSGSCALLSFYDSRSRLLRVACTGDSRAVLGRRSAASGKWTATPLSIDQTGGTASEAARLRAEHPGEPYVTLNGRVLGGLEPSRAFGDAVYKWSRETQEQIKSSYFGRSPSKYLKTPPYVTAEPVVTTTRMEPGRGDFVVMATDGLWEMLTNDEVIGLVGQWLEKEKLGAEQPGASGSSSGAGWLAGWFSTNDAAQRTALPVERHSDSTANDNNNADSGQRAPIRQQQWGIPAQHDERFVVQDRNAATHLVRNALGGRDGDTLSALLTLPSPYARRYRDDLTVEVIFFGEGRGGGRVELNADASATASGGNGGGWGDGGLKAKL